MVGSELLVVTLKVKTFSVQRIINLIIILLLYKKTNVTFTDVHLQKFYSTHIHV